MEKENNVLELEKSNKTGVILLIVGLLLIIGGSVYCYINYFNNPSYIVKKGINKVTNIYKESKKQEKSGDKPFNISGNLEFDFKANDNDVQKMFDVFNNLDILYNFDIYTKNEISYFKLNSKYEDKDLININMYQEKKLLYIYLEDLFDKYIKLSELSEIVDNIENENKVNDKDIEIIIQGLFDALSNSFLENDFHREKEELTIENKKVEVYNNYILYNKENYKEINERLIKNINDNKELINTLNKVFGEDKVKEIFNEIKEMDDIEDSSIEMCIYTKGLTNEFVKMIINLEVEDSNLIFEINNEDVIKVSVIGEGIDMMISLEQNDLNNYFINLNIIEEELGNINVKLSMIMESIKEVSEIDISNVIDYDKLGEDDFNNIMEKISKNETINMLIKDITNVFSNVNSGVLSM